MKTYHTQWSGQFYTAAELTRRGYTVTFTLGNAKMTDLIVQSPERCSFSIEVKTMSTKNFWIFNDPESSSDDWFWVFVFMSESLDDPPRYFIMTSDEVLREWHSRNDKNPPDTSFPGLNWGTVQEHEGQWDRLPR